MRHAALASPSLFTPALVLGLVFGLADGEAVASYAAIEFSTEIAFDDGSTGRLDAWFGLSDAADFVLENSATFSIFYGEVEGSIRIDGETVYEGGPAEMSFVSNHGGESRDGFQFNAGDGEHQFSFAMDDSTGTAFGSVWVDEPFFGIVGAEIFEDFDASAFDHAWIAGDWFARDLRYTSTTNFAGAVRNVPPIPEPGAAMLFGTGWLTLAAWVRLRADRDGRPTRRNFLG